MSETFGLAAARLSGAAAMLLGWRPKEFWDATPAELAAALQLDEPPEGPDAAAVAELMRRFPDERER
jgi:hypothetical protein